MFTLRQTISTQACNKLIQCTHTMESMLTHTHTNKQPHDLDSISTAQVIKQYHLCQHHHNVNSQSCKSCLGICGSKTRVRFQMISFDLNRVTQGPMTRLRITQSIPQTNTKTATIVFAFHILSSQSFVVGGIRQCHCDE